MFKTIFIDLQGYHQIVHFLQIFERKLLGL